MEKFIVDYLNRLSAYKTQKLILSEGALSLVQDDKETIERWTEFMKVVIDEKAISLTASENYYFPKKSMKAEDYELLVTEVKSKIIKE